LQRGGGVNARVVCWFSCGAASAVAAHTAIRQFGAAHPISVVYCDTSKDEHPDNARFMRDVEGWLGRQVTVIRSPDYGSIEEVFAARRYMSGIKGACCTVALKKVPRFHFQEADDINVFGYTAEETKRIADFEEHNPELSLAWVLRDHGIRKKDCFRMLAGAGIRLPQMYALGYRNNNCIGCVKATSARYWSMIRSDFPEVFWRRAEQSRGIGVRLVRYHGERIFLDELPREDYSLFDLENVSCGPECAG
jgi:hypothetical protein